MRTSSPARAHQGQVTSDPLAGASSRRRWPAAAAVVTAVVLALAGTSPAAAGLEEGLADGVDGTGAMLQPDRGGSDGDWSSDISEVLYQSPGVPPPGANDFTCDPTVDHPHPVVLVHGTFADMTESWNLISPALVARGYCVFALDYGDRATEDIRDSARELKEFVVRVREATGAQRVSIVGHSQGGMMPRWYIKFLGGAEHVEDLIGLSPSNHGTETPLAAYAGFVYCPACIQQIAGSEFLQQLNDGDETPGLVSYTQVQTRYDEVVVPFTSAFLEDQGPRTTNVLLQETCPLDTTDHLGIIYDPVALQWIVNALGRDGPADPGFRPTCLATSLEATATD